MPAAAQAQTNPLALALLLLCVLGSPSILIAGAVQVAMVTSDPFGCPSTMPCQAGGR